MHNTGDAALSIEPEFIESLLHKFADVSSVEAHATDEDGKALASTCRDRFPETTEAVRRAIARKETAETEEAEADRSVCAVPVFSSGNLAGTIAVRGGRREARATAEAAARALESVLEYEAFSASRDDEDPHGALVHRLLAEGADEREVRSRMNRLELDPTLLRAVVCVKLDYRQNRYFNINLNLGYRSSSERIRTEIIDRVRKSAFFTSQDICVGYDSDTILLIKSFLAASDRAKVRLALDRICSEMAAYLSGLRAISFGMACGNAYEGISRVRASRDEALEIMEIGERVDPKRGYFRLNDIMFDAVLRNLSPLIRANAVEPYLALLDHPELVACGELFVDSCMSVATAARVGYLHRNTIGKRMRKLEELTGLNPALSFRDAFIFKMLAVHARMKGVESEEKLKEARKSEIQ